MAILSDPFTFLCYGLLFLSVVLLWVPTKGKIPLWWGAFGASVVFGLLSHRIGWQGVGALVCGGLFLLLSRSEKVSKGIRFLGVMGAFLLGEALYFHKVPGFYNLRVLKDIYISPDAIPFTLYFNFDKVAFGILILGFLVPRISFQREWREMLKEAFPRALLVIGGIAILSYAIGFIKIDIKVPECTGVWAVTNLLFVCMAEEAFFRGFLQKNLYKAFESTPFKSYGAIVIASLLFGLMHYYGGPLYIVLSVCAGMGYGWVYQATGRIEASILTHFSLNFLHFIVFTYPALKSAF